MVTQKQVVVIITALLVMLLAFPERFNTLWARSEHIIHRLL